MTEKARENNVDAVNPSIAMRENMRAFRSYEL